MPDQSDPYKALARLCCTATLRTQPATDKCQSVFGLFIRVQSDLTLATVSESKQRVNKLFLDGPCTLERLMTLDHKKRFRETQFGKLWSDATAAEWFQQGLQTALLEFRKQVSPPVDIGSASANEMQTQGAEKFVRILLNLTEVTPERKSRLDQNLDFHS